MQEFNQQYQLMDSFSAAYSGNISASDGRGTENSIKWSGDKADASAAPMEKYAGNTTDHGEAGHKYLCPKCREGSLRRIKGKNGAFWGCSNYPRCTATFDDEKDMPVLNN